MDDSRNPAEQRREPGSTHLPNTRMASSAMPDHSGKGPRSYQRADTTIYQDACERLSEDPYIDASDIDVQVKDHEIILTGTVDTRETKRRTEHVVEQVKGVTNVENRLRVRREEDLRTKVKETYR